MSLLDQFSLGDYASFEVYPSGILKTSYTNVQIKAIVDADTARYWIDPPALHANVFPTLPQGTPNDYQAYSYLKIILPDGTPTAVGIPWIDESTFEVQTLASLRFTVENVNPSDRQRIIQALSSNGYTAVSVSVLEGTPE